MHLHVEFSCDLHLVVQQDRSGADAVLSCNYDDNVIIFVTFVSGYTWQHLHAPDHITCCLLTVIRIQYPRCHITDHTTVFEHVIGAHAQILVFNVHIFCQGSMLT